MNAVQKIFSKINVGTLMSGLGLIGLFAVFVECGASHKLKHATDRVTVYKEGGSHPAWLVRYGDEERIVLQRHVAFELGACTDGWVGPWVFDKKLEHEEENTVPWCTAVDRFLTKQRTLHDLKEIQF